MQEGWKGKRNQVRNIFIHSLGHPPHGASIFLVVMRGWISPFILEIACGLSSTIPGWGKYLDQGSPANIDESPEVREQLFCKPKGVQQDENLFLPGATSRKY